MAGSRRLAPEAPRRLRASVAVRGMPRASRAGGRASPRCGSWPSGPAGGPRDIPTRGRRRHPSRHGRGSDTTPGLPPATTAATPPAVAAWHVRCVVRHAAALRHRRQRGFLRRHRHRALRRAGGELHLAGKADGITWRVRDIAGRGKASEGSDLLAGMVQRLSFADRVVLLVADQGPVARQDGAAMAEDAGPSRTARYASRSTRDSTAPPASPRPWSPTMAGGHSTSPSPR